MARAEPAGIQLTAKDAGVIKGMIKRGDRLQDIAAWFGVNQARISEIKDRKKFGSVEATVEGLPPAGPYGSASGRTTAKVIKALEDTAAALDLAKEAVGEALAEIGRRQP
jgi:hypothetical protein